MRQFDYKNKKNENKKQMTNHKKMTGKLSFTPENVSTFNQSRFKESQMF